MAGWREHVAALPSGRLCILGVGSELKADDAAGMLLIEKLQPSLAERENVLLVPGSTAPENCTGPIKQFAPDHILVVDAAHLADQPGAIREIPLSEIKEVSLSTHMLPLPFLLNYLTAECGCTVSMLGVQVASTELGEPPDPRVVAAIADLADCLLTKLT